MSKIQEIVFPDEDERLVNELPEPKTPVSVDGWFEGYGDMLTVDDLAVILHVSRKTVQNQCRRGDLPAVLIGRRWYVPKTHLVEFLTTGRKSKSDE